MPIVRTADGRLAVTADGPLDDAAVLAAVDVTGVDLDDHRVVVFGAGSAGIGIANQVRGTMLRHGASETEEEALRRFAAIKD